MSGWRELAMAGRFEEAEAEMLAETDPPAPDQWPQDPESQGAFYENWGDRLAPSLAANEKYRRAHSNYAVFASWSTSGGEGAARMLDVNRVLEKIEEIDRQSI